MAVQTALMASTTRTGRRVTRHTVAAQEDAPPTKNRAFARSADHKDALSGRSKRHLIPADRHLDHPPASKRPKTSEFEIVLQSKSTTAPTTDPRAQAATTNPDIPSEAVATELHRQSQHNHQATRHNQSQTRQVAAPAIPTTDASKVSRGNKQTSAPLTKHQEKVINGIKHELGRLQPSGADTKDQPGGRKLRSQEASRFKSELSAYFPDYDEVIGNEPKEQHILNIETPIVVTDTFPRYFQGKVVAPLFTPSASGPGSIDQSHNDYPARGYGDALFYDIFDSQRIDFDFLGTSYRSKSLEDPLSDDLYLPVHKKAERLERSIRNTEKGRAQHEKDQIIRLLDGLQGHDWLRTMGVSGVTESKKKSFEPARQHFIKGCQAILDKFRQWSLAEKRRKAEKERALAEAAERRESEASDSAAVESDEEDEEDDEENDDEDGEDEEAAEEEEDDDSSNGADENDVDASIAKQLRQEAAARSRMARANRRTPQPPKPAPPPPEFKSFFKKKHERDTALNKNRRTGRRVLAWGEPLPDMPEREYELPEEYLDPETMKGLARKRRRQRRGSRH